MSLIETVRIVAEKTKGNDTGFSVLNKADFDPKIHKLFEEGKPPAKNDNDDTVVEGSAEYFADKKLFKTKADLQEYLDDLEVEYESDANRDALEALCVKAYEASKS